MVKKLIDGGSGRSMRVWIRCGLLDAYVRRLCVLSLLIWPLGRLHRSRQTRAKTLQHLGRDSSALGARQFDT